MSREQLEEEAMMFKFELDFCESIVEYVYFLKDIGRLDGRIDIVDRGLLQKSISYLLDTPRFEEILKYIDLSNVSLDGVNVTSKDLSNTNININPQSVLNKTLYGCNLEGIDMKDKDFNGVCIEGTNLKDTNSYIDLDNIRGNLCGTNLDGCTCIVTPEVLDEIEMDKFTYIDNTLFLDKKKVKK